MAESSFDTTTLTQGADNTHSTSIICIVRNLCASLNLNADDAFNMSTSELNDLLNARMDDANRVKLDVDEKLQLDVCNRDLATASRRANKACSSVYFASETLKLLFFINDKVLSSAPDTNYEFEEVCELVKPPEQGDQKLSRYQNLLIHVMRYAWKNGYKKSGDSVYERIRTGGNATCAWKRVCSIEELVHKSARKGDNFEQWINLTSSPGNAAAAAQYLMSSDDYEFPVIKRDRHVFAFRNGIYISTEDKFYKYDELQQNYQYADCAASKYFDCEIDDSCVCVDAWDSLHTPNFQSILTYQGFDDDGIAFWMYVMVGRLLYEVGEMDNWQVIPFLKGMAGSGKSTILLNVCKLLFDDADIGVLSNNIERKFGLWGFCNKKLFIAPEIKTDLHLDQAEFQSLVSGDAMQVAQKHMQSETISWKVPGILAGNEVPAWKDASGSITRRIVLFHFAKSVTDVDTQLGVKLRNEMPILLIKCNKAYRKALDDVGTRNIWDALPQYFKDTQKDLQACVDSLWSYMTSGELEFGPELYMPWNTFLTMFRDYCKGHNIANVSLNKTNSDSWGRTLGSFSCRKDGVRSQRFYPIGSNFPKDSQVCHWLIGADISSALREGQLVL